MSFLSRFKVRKTMLVVSMTTFSFKGLNDIKINGKRSSILYF